jgi:hypothetical protein
MLGFLVGGSPSKSKWGKKSFGTAIVKFNDFIQPQTKILEIWA